MVAAEPTHAGTGDIGVEVPDVRPGTIGQDLDQQESLST